MGNSGGYPRHPRGASGREQHHHGFWLREKAFADILAHSGLDQSTLDWLYHTGRIGELYDFVLRMEGQAL